MITSRIKSKSFVDVGMLLPPVKGLYYRIHDFTFVLTTTVVTVVYLFAGSSYNSVDPKEYGTILDTLTANVVTASVMNVSTIAGFNGWLYAMLNDPDLYITSPGEGVGISSSAVCTILSGSHIRFEEFWI
jgi:hypothetical protein